MTLSPVPIIVLCTSVSWRMMSFVHDFYNMSENRDGDVRICDIGTDIWLVMAIHTEPFQS